MSKFQTTSEWIPVGQAYYADLSSAVELTDTPTDGVALPATADTAIINIVGAAVHLEQDGTAATTSQPQLPVGVYAFENSRTFLTKLSFIESAASATLHIFYFNVNGS